MPERRQVLRALLTAGAAAALPAGCGIPTGGSPKVYGTGPVYDPIGSGTLPAPDPDRATTTKELVELFLAAISGPLDPESLKDAQERAGAFLTAEARAKWNPTGGDVVVLRVSNLTPSTSGADTVVSGTLQPVGSLSRDRGAVDPYPGDPAPVPAQFTVTSTTAGYRIRAVQGLPSNRLPLAVDALISYYTAQLIYFWDASRSWMVPELRYVPRTVGLDAQLTQIVSWLLLGPTSADLTGPVTTNLIPSNTTLVGRVTIQGAQVTVPFSAALQGADLERIQAQVQWSMQPLHPLSDGVELQIGGQKQQLGGALDRYRQANLADASSGRADTPQGFYVVDRTVQPQAGAPPRVLTDPDVNKDVVSAALSRDGQAAAIVTTANRLVIGRTDKGSPSVQSVDELRGTHWSRPVWLPSSRRLLVAVDGALYAVSAAGEVTAQLIPSGVSAFGVSPDGFRIALIQNGGLQVAALDQHTGDQPSVGNARPLDPGLTGPSAVAWSRVDRVVVAGIGPNRQWQLAEIGVDGAIRDLWQAIYGYPIESVVAYAKLPTQVSSPGPVMLQTADKIAFRAYVNSQPDQLLPPDAPSSGPSPSGAAARRATAPFFPD